MKKILIAAATAGLMTLAACQPTPANNTVAADNGMMGDEANSSMYNGLEPTTTIDNATPPAMDNTAEMETTNTTGNAM